MIKKSKHVITDAVVVIHAHECNYWSYLCHTYHIALPATILEQEVFYFNSARGKQRIDSSRWIKDGMVVRLEAEAADHARLFKKLSSQFMYGIHAGEQEALALLLSEKMRDYYFTTADQTAIKALGILGCGRRGVSVEELLKTSGLLGNKVRLPAQYSKATFDKKVAEGFGEQHLWLK